MKIRELPYLLGFQPKPQTYGFEVGTFNLPRDGAIRYAQWLHPREKRKAISQEQVDALRRFLSPGDFALDIGAHTGDSAIPMALAVGPGGCVLALEPNRFVFPVLQKNASLNREKANIMPLMFAATTVDGTFEFEYSDAGFCNGGRHEGINRWRHGHAFPLSVEGRNLAAYLGRHNGDFVRRLRYIKVDTEGYDLAVLRTLEDLIDQRRPYIQAEVFRHLDLEGRRDLFRFFSEKGFAIHRIESEGRYPGRVLREEDMQGGEHFDIFCTPRA